MSDRPRWLLKSGGIPYRDNDSAAPVAPDWECCEGDAEWTALTTVGEIELRAMLRCFAADADDAVYHADIRESERLEELQRERDRLSSLSW